jgi:hypothetical protein
VISPIDGPPVLLLNVNPDHHHWVEVQLVGRPKSPRDAMCATAFLTANGMRQRQDVLASGSYISSNDRRLHFGLGMRRMQEAWRSTGHRAKAKRSSYLK